MSLEASDLFSPSHSFIHSLSLSRFLRPDHLIRQSTQYHHLARSFSPFLASPFCSLLFAEYLSSLSLASCSSSYKLSLNLSIHFLPPFSLYLTSVHLSTVFFSPCFVSKRNYTVSPFTTESDQGQKPKNGCVANKLVLLFEMTQEIENTRYDDTLPPIDPQQTFEKRVVGFFFRGEI